MITLTKGRSHWLVGKRVARVDITGPHKVFCGPAHNLEQIVFDDGSALTVITVEDPCHDATDGYIQQSCYHPPRRPRR
jgi:hypothetical protein